MIIVVVISSRCLKERLFHRFEEVATLTNNAG